MPRPLYVAGTVVVTVVMAILLQLRAGGGTQNAAPVNAAWNLLNAEVSNRITASRHYAQRYPKNSLAWERLAAAHLERARLHGSLADLTAAESSLDRAFAVAPAGGGPFLARAHFNLYVHRLPAAERDLDVLESAVLVSDRERAAIVDMRAQIDVQVGRADQARARWTALAADRDEPGAWFGLAMLAWKAGDATTGQAHLDRADRAAMGSGDMRLQAWLRLQRGLLELDRERWADALTFYQQADAIFPGWPLIREHVAEALSNLGRTAEAIAIYEELVDQTADPLFLDALADCYDSTNRRAAATAARTHAAAGWQALLTRYPEAGAGHAVAHLLARGDLATALPLARRNAELRPYGASFGLLAEVLAASGQHAEARQLAVRAVADGWYTAEVRALLEPVAGDL